MTTTDKKKPIALILGCLLVAILAGSVIVCAGAGVVLYTVGDAEDSRPLHVADAISIANLDPRAAAALGTPISVQKKKRGGVTTFIDDEMLDIVVVVTGPRGSGEFHVAGSRKRGRLWSYDTLVLTPDGGEPIDLRTRPR